jgi:hypothetical protein
VFLVLCEIEKKRAWFLDEGTTERANKTGFWRDLLLQTVLFSFFRTTNAGAPPMVQ